MGIKQTILDCIPPAYYEDGTEAKCWIYKICDMFDVNSQSYKIVKEKIDMSKIDEDAASYNFLKKWIVEKEKGNETKATFGHINHFVSDESKGLPQPVWGPEIKSDGTLVES